jgi:O-antigen ligase
MTGFGKRSEEVGGANPSCAIGAGVRWTFCLLMLSIPFDIPRRPIPVDVPTLTAMLFLAAASLRYRICFARIPPALPCFLIYLYVAMASSIVAGMDYSGEVIWSFCQLLQPILVFWAAYNVLRCGRMLRIAACALLVACVVRALIQLGGVAMGESWGAHADVSFGQDRNNATSILGLGAIAGVGIAFGRFAGSSLPPVVLWPAIAALGTAILAMGSRGGLVAIAGGMLALLARRGVPRPWLRKVVPVALVLVVFYGVALRQDALRARFEEAWRYGALSGRERLYPALWDMFLQKPWLGWGLVSNQYELGARERNPDPTRAYARRDCHNTALELLTSAGIAGFLPFFIGICICVRAAWRARHGAEGAVPLALLTTIIITSMSIGWLAAKLGWIVLGYVLVSARDAAPRFRHRQPLRLRVIPA